MKYLGMLLILTAGTALGANAGSSLRKRYHSWMELKMLVGVLKGELQYGSDPLAVIFERLSEKTEGTFGSFFHETAKEMEAPGNGSLMSVLQENAKNCLGTSGLTPKEQCHLVKICTLMGSLDREAQLMTLEGYLDTIRQEEQLALEKVKQKETMYRCLGFMGGLFCAVLLY